MKTPTSTRRAILLFTTDEAMRRIHEVCCRLDDIAGVTPPGVAFRLSNSAGSNPSAEADAGVSRTSLKPGEKA